MAAPRSQERWTTVADLVLRSPRTSSPSATVRDLWDLFANRRVHITLLTSGNRLLGCVTREDLVGAPLAAPAMLFASTRGRIVSSELPMEAARDLFGEAGVRRMAAVDDGGCLVGLLCLKQSRAGFCSDSGIESRALERRAGVIAALDGVDETQTRLVSIRDATRVARY